MTCGSKTVEWLCTITRYLLFIEVNSRDTEVNSRDLNINDSSHFSIVGGGPFLLMWRPFNVQSTVVGKKNLNSHQQQTNIYNVLHVFRLSTKSCNDGVLKCCITLLLTILYSQTPHSFWSANPHFVCYWALSIAINIVQLSLSVNTLPLIPWIIYPCYRHVSDNIRLVRAPMNQEPNFSYPFVHEIEGKRGASA